MNLTQIICLTKIIFLNEIKNLSKIIKLGKITCHSKTLKVRKIIAINLNFIPVQRIKS